MSTIKSSAENLTLNADGANNDVIIQSNGSTKVTVDGQNSRVGIGTTSPTQPLHVAGNIYTTGYLNTAGSGTAGGVQFADGNLYMYRATNDLAVKLQGAEKLRIQSGGGITFNGDTAAANALDDYEEGTFTPQIYVDSSHTGIVYGAQTGVYTKIGNLVTCFVAVGLSSKGSNSGNVTFRNLPFTISNSSADTSLDGGCANWGYWAGTSGINYFTFVGNGAVNYATGYAQTSATANCNATFTNSHITDGFSLRFTFQFLTDV